MKQLKFLMIAITLLMGISFTSCIGEGDPTVTNVAFGRVTESFPRVVIESNYGVKFNATNDLTGLSLYTGDYVYFQYSYDSDLQKVDQNTKSIDANITIGEKIANRSAVTAADKGESYENVTILQIGDGPNTTSNYSIQFMYYDKSKLIVPLFFLVKEASKESLEKHDFTLVYDEESVKAGDTEIVFYLRQRSSETEAKKTVLSYKMFDINRALEQFKVTTGNKPTKVVIYANETKDNTSDALDKKKEELTKYAVVYDFKD